MFAVYLHFFLLPWGRPRILDTKKNLLIYQRYVSCNQQIPLDAHCKSGAQRKLLSSPAPTALLGEDMKMRQAGI